MDVADQAGSRVAAFEQVVAEDLVFGEALLHRDGEGIDVVDPFADERAFVEHVLIDVGDRARVRVNSRLTGAELYEQRWTLLFQADRDAWLQDAIALGDDFSLLINLSTIENVRERSDKLPCGIAREQRVGVERDDELRADQ